MPSEQLFDLRTYLDHDVLAAYKDYQPIAQVWRRNPTRETGRLGVDSTSVLRKDEGNEHVPANQDLNIAHRYKMIE